MRTFPGNVQPVTGLHSQIDVVIVKFYCFEVVDFDLNLSLIHLVYF